MNHDGLRRMAAWPLLIATACVLVLAGCQDSSGPGVVAPDVKSAPEGKKSKPPQPPPTPADPAIAFVVSAPNGYNRLNVMDADSSNPTTIFTSERRVGLHCGPSWSPDGTSIVFPYGTWFLWIIDVSVVGGVPTGTNARVLVDQASNPAWSPLGDLIAFADWGGDLATIQTVQPDGSNRQVIYTSESELDIPQHPTWSRDASQIAFTEGGAIHILDVSTGVATTVLGAEWGQQFSGGPGFLDWARGQDVLAFSVGSGNGGDQAVYTMQLPAGTPTFVVEGWCPTWSPDDQKICFSGGIIDLSTLEILHTGAYPGWFDWRR